MYCCAKNRRFSAIIAILLTFVFGGVIIQKTKTENSYGKFFMSSEEKPI